jgi:hypothetical protein
VLLECSWHAKGRFSQSTDQSCALIILVSLVELIVLNVGLQAKILDQRVFSMFVLHALVLTFITTPLTILIYPSRYRVHASTALEKPLAPGTSASTTPDDFTRFKFSFVLDCIEQLPSAMTLAQLLQRPSASTWSSVSEKSPKDQNFLQSEMPVLPKFPDQRTISIDAIRLLELTERTSAVLKSQATDTLIRNDPVLSVFRTFGRLNHFSVSASLSVISFDEFSTHVADHARQNGSQMVVIPLPLTSLAPEASTNHHTVLSSPFDTLFSKAPVTDEAASLLRSQFIRRVFASSPSDVALFIDRGLSTDSSSTIQPHVFLPFFGGPDDRLALSFVIQLCMHEGISATVVRFHRLESDGNESVYSIGDKSAAQLGDVRFTFVTSDNT